MFRTVALVPFLVACDVGEVPIGGGGGGDGGNMAACVNRAATIPAAYQHAGGATHAGEGCIVVGCHLAGSAGPTFYAAGTVYKTDKVTPNGGATIRIQNGGSTLTAVADAAGNFVFRTQITFPTQTEATACPDTAPMVTPLAQGSGNCTSSSCHLSTAAQGVIKF